MEDVLKGFYRWKGKLRLNYIKRIFANRMAVHSGPFEGMKYLWEAHGSAIVPKLVGSYEEPIRPWVEQVKARGYKRIIDIGCAEGYYAVGFAFANAASEIMAFDIAQQAQEMCGRLCALNGVEGKVKIGGECDHALLEEIAGEGTLVFCDIEGAEDLLLDLEKVPRLCRTDMIVETHDFLNEGVTSRLIERFKHTHTIEVVADTARDKKAYEKFWPKSVSQKMKHRCLGEGRPQGMMWLRLSALPQEGQRRTLAQEG